MLNVSFSCNLSSKVMFFLHCSKTFKHFLFGKIAFLQRKYHFVEDFIKFCKARGVEKCRRALKMLLRGVWHACGADTGAPKVGNRSAAGGGVTIIYNKMYARACFLNIIKGKNAEGARGRRKRQRRERTQTGVKSPE